MCLIVLIVSGCEGEKKITTWGLTGHDVPIVFRVEGGGDNLGLYCSAKYFELDRSGEYTPDVLGVGILQHFPIGSDPGQIPIPAWLEPLLLGMSVKPYAGGEIDFPLKNQNEDEVYYLLDEKEDPVVYVNDKGRDHDIRANALAGLAFSLDPEFRWAIVVEATSGDGWISGEDDSSNPTADDGEVLVGAYGNFKF